MFRDLRQCNESENPGKMPGFSKPSQIFRMAKIHCEYLTKKGTQCTRTALDQTFHNGVCINVCNAHFCDANNIRDLNDETVHLVNSRDISVFTRYVYTSCFVECLRYNDHCISRDDESAPLDKTYEPSETIVLNNFSAFRLDISRSDAHSIDAFDQISRSLVEHIQRAKYVKISMLDSRDLKVSSISVGNDPRGMKTGELLLPRIRSVSISKDAVAFNEAASYFWAVKSHHFENLYEMYGKINICGSVIKVVFNYGF
jgi:hypothetical protein